MSCPCCGYDPAPERRALLASLDMPDTPPSAAMEAAAVPWRALGVWAYTVKPAVRYVTQSWTTRALPQLEGLGVCALIAVTMLDGRCFHFLPVLPPAQRLEAGWSARVLTKALAIPPDPS